MKLQRNLKIGLDNSTAPSRQYKKEYRLKTGNIITNQNKINSTLGNYFERFVNTNNQSVTFIADLPIGQPTPDTVKTITKLEKL